MLPRLARAIESLFGGSLASAAGLLRGAAQLALLLAVAVPLVRAALAFTAFRYGWETALVVRCPRCRRLVADPETATCPEGHPVRFPADAPRPPVRSEPTSRAASSAATGTPANSDPSLHGSVAGRPGT